MAGQGHGRRVMVATFAGAQAHNICSVKHHYTTLWPCFGVSGQIIYIQHFTPAGPERTIIYSGTFPIDYTSYYYTATDTFLVTTQ